PRKGHVGDFRAFERDLDALVEQVLEPFCRPPWFALGHSMGAAIALAKACAGRSPFARMVLTAPMIEIHGLRFRRALRILARALVILGQGRRFVPGGGPKPYMSASFEGNVLTSDSSRHGRAAAIIEAAPRSDWRGSGSGLCRQRRFYRANSTGGAFWPVRLPRRDQPGPQSKPALAGAFPLPSALETLA
ncbi:MAG: alpha/beta fold hydrolase, partial [Pseudomonadota bacterium]